MLRKVIPCVPELMLPELHCEGLRSVREVETISALVHHGQTARQMDLVPAIY